MIRSSFLYSVDQEFVKEGVLFFYEKNELEA